MIDVFGLLESKSDGIGRSAVAWLEHVLVTLTQLRSLVHDAPSMARDGSCVFSAAMASLRLTGSCSFQVGPEFVLMHGLDLGQRIPGHLQFIQCLQIFTAIEAAVAVP